MRARVGIAVVGLVAVAVAIVLFIPGSLDHGSGVADRIRTANSATIREVDYFPQNFTGHIEDLTIYLVPNATDAQVVDAWCNVIVAAGVDQMPAAHVHLRLAGTAEPSDAGTDSRPLAKPVCP